MCGIWLLLSSDNKKSKKELGLEEYQKNFNNSAFSVEAIHIWCAQKMVAFGIPYCIKWLIIY